MKQTATKARIPYLDFLKFFAIASVFLGHATEQTTGNDFWDNPIWSFIYTYHMPLFMLLCGYFFGSSLKLSFGELVKKKFMQLGVPSITAWILMFVFVKLTDYNPYPEIVDLSWLGFMNAMWFLKCVFFCYLIGWIFVKAMRNVWIAALTSTVIVHLVPIFSIDSVNFLLPMFWAGYLCNLHQAWIDSHRKKLLSTSLVAFATLLTLWSGRLTVYMVPIDFFHWDTLTFDVDNLGTAVYRLAIGLSGSMLFFLLSPGVYERIKDWRITPIFDKLGKCTLGLYWMQTFLLECTWHSIGIYVSTANSFWVAPVIACFELALCYLAVLLFKKNKYTRRLVLGENI